MADYGNWVRRRIIITMGIVGGLGLLISLLPIGTFLRISALLIGLIILATTGYILYVYRQFSESGGNIQRKLWDFVLKNLDWDGQGKALDIGTGNGPLAIALAKQHPQARVVGIDFWGDDWEYSQGVCERNALVEGVADRVSFQKGTAADLPFADGEFDAAISHFVFHEIADSQDKRDVIREALRVLRKGGVFAFQDMFYDQGIYGDMQDLMRVIESWDIEAVHFVDTRSALKIPFRLRHPRVLGNAGLIYGTK